MRETDISEFLMHVVGTLLNDFSDWNRLRRFACYSYSFAYWASWPLFESNSVYRCIKETVIRGDAFISFRKIFPKLCKNTNGSVNSSSQ